MSKLGMKHLKSWLKRQRKPVLVTNVEGQYGLELRKSNPVENFYHHRARTHLDALYRFALQSQSLSIRNVIAKASSDFKLDFDQLLWLACKIAEHEFLESNEQTIIDGFDPKILLKLADLLVNTSRDDIDIYNAVHLYVFVSEIYGYASFDESNKLQYVEALNDLQQYDEADRLSSHFSINKLAFLQIELLRLQRVRRNSNLVEWLEEINLLYESLNLSRVCLGDADSVPPIDQLSAATDAKIYGPKVSVIVPTYSPGNGIRTAIRSLLEQTWQNLEIIVVDDASPRGFMGIFSELEQLDSRIKVLHREVNAGAYVARNAGLRVATGEFITTHDDDDWSHPDKIAVQVTCMLENREIIATTSAHIRTTEDLEFRRVNIQAKYMQMNYSSLMFRKTAVDEVGSWDTVNRGGDSEFYTRLVEYYGDDRVVNLLDRPLSFSRLWDGSLTSGEMSRGFFAYSRLLYRWAFRQWHWDCRKVGKNAVRTQATRPYAIPSTFEAGARNRDLGQFDVIYVTDLYRQSKYVNFVLTEMTTLSEAGFRVGYIHLNSPETTRAAGFLKALFDLQLEGKLTQISHDDIAKTRLLLVYDPAIGMFLDGVESSVLTERALVIDRELPILAGGEARSAVCLHQALQNLDSCFKSRFEIIGATRRDQNRLRTKVPSLRILEDEFVWETHVSLQISKPSPPRGTPLVGFHSYGNQYRWPNSRSQFESIYLSPMFRTKLYGSLNAAVEKFGRDLLDLVEVIPVDAQSEEEYLSTIDFWVYYPNSRLIDQVWGPALAAMASGKVTIMPRSLRSIYGDAAVYAEVEEVASVITELSSNPDAYIRQAKLGQEFVRVNHDRTNLVSRVATLTKSIGHP